MMDSDDDHPAFDNESIWPRRLLHVPSMTSYKWTPGNCYGGRRNPQYVAISYTWGKFALKQDAKEYIKPLRIRNVPWAIPRVDPDCHFSVGEFQNVIRETMKTAERYYEFDYAKDQSTIHKTPLSRLVRPLLRYIERHRAVYEFIWLDIACIDQRQSPTKMAEIGRQARIFQNAKHSYAWLSHLSHAELNSALGDLENAIDGLQKEPWHPGSDLAFDSGPWVSLAKQAIAKLTDDPWFKSLWTLQEGFLCNHAIIFSREGRVSCDKSRIVVQSVSLNYLFKLAYDILSWSMRTRTPNTEQAFQLLSLIHRTGLASLYLNNPMGLLGVSSNRNPRHEADRVYGIMQAFGTNFRVGNALHYDQDRVYTLQELETEFGATILQTYPVLSQMHIHLQPPAAGAGWRVQRNSAIPWIVERGDLFGWNNGNRVDTNIEITTHTLCNLSTQMISGSQWAHLSGKVCEFNVLQNAWKDADDSEYAKKLEQSLWRMHGFNESIHMIALDRGTYLEPLPSDFDGVNVKSPQRLSAWIAKQPHKQPLFVFLLGRTTFHGESFCSGMILFERKAHDIRYWCRLGICIWLYSHMRHGDNKHPLWSLLKGDSDDWSPLDGIFG